MPSAMPPGSSAAGSGRCVVCYRDFGVKTVKRGSGLQRPYNPLNTSGLGGGGVSQEVVHDSTCVYSYLTK